MEAYASFEGLHEDTYGLAEDEQREPEISQVERQDEAEDRRRGREPDGVRQQHRARDQGWHAVGDDESRLREGVIRRPPPGEQRAVTAFDPVYAPWPRSEASQEGVLARSGAASPAAPAARSQIQTVDQAPPSQRDLDAT